MPTGGVPRIDALDPGGKKGVGMLYPGRPPIKLDVRIRHLENTMCWQYGVTAKQCLLSVFRAVSPRKWFSLDGPI